LQKGHKVSKILPSQRTLLGTRSKKTIV